MLHIIQQSAAGFYYYSRITILICVCKRETQSFSVWLCIYIIASCKENKDTSENLASMKLFRTLIVANPLQKNI